MSWLYSQALVEEYSEGISLDGEPCALWSGKPTQLPSWCNDKTMARCQLSQSGTTFKPLTDDLGEDVLTSFLEAFPAKTSVAPAKEQESKGSDLPCGRTWQELSMKCVQRKSSSKIALNLLWVEDLEPSSLTLPKWGYMSVDGELWERITLPHLTSGTGSGSWPTPTCQEVEHPEAKLTDTGRRLSKDGMSSHSLNLADSVKQWPTPCTRDYKGANAEEGLIRNDGKSRMDQLPNAVKYITPRVGGEESLDSVEKRKGREAAERHNTLASVEAAHGEQTGQLNPDWVEWLMGWQSAGLAWNQSPS